VDVGDPADPYWPGYTGVSDMDYVMRYNDYGRQSLRKPDHTPLYLEFVQTTYSWSAPAGLDEVLVHTYHVTSTRYDLRDVYVTFWLDPNVGSISDGANFLDDYSVYDPDLRLALGVDAPGGTDGDAFGPIGVMLLPPDGAGPLTYTWKWGSDPYAPGMIPQNDRAKYAEIMTTGEVMQDQQVPTGSHFTLSVGPFAIARGDTLSFRVGQVFGEGVEGATANAALVRRLAEQDFAVPAPPPMPPVTAVPGDRRVRLVWAPTPARNPEAYRDPNRADDAEQPFEGYRVYKSTVSATGPWTLLAEYDVPLNGVSNDFGLERELTDDLLLNNVEYYYSVVAFSKPDAVLNWPSLQSSINANAVTVVPGTPPPDTVGEVAVVPNPYRGDVAYNTYDPPWERPPPSRQQWLEQDRRLQFINLPPRCEIKVYTVSGQLVQTLVHEDASRGYEDWNLTSSVGQAIASGIYVFTVEDLETRDVQVGKFVVIK
jgi:hypothetical protein